MKQILLTLGTIAISAIAIYLSQQQPQIVDLPKPATSFEYLQFKQNNWYREHPEVKITTLTNLRENLDVIDTTLIYRVIKTFEDNGVLNALIVTPSLDTLSVELTSIRIEKKLFDEDMLVQPKEALTQANTKFDRKKVYPAIKINEHKIVILDDIGNQVTTNKKMCSIITEH